MSKFVVRFDYLGQRSEFLGHGSYFFLGVKYAVLTSYREAKRYTSENRARAAVKKLVYSCINTSNTYKIIEVNDNE